MSTFINDGFMMILSFFYDIDSVRPCPVYYGQTQKHRRKIDAYACISILQRLSLLSNFRCPNVQYLPVAASIFLNIG